MDEAKQRAMLSASDGMRAFVQAGGRTDWDEPPIRRRKGTDHKAARVESGRIFNPGRYDALSWRASSLGFGYTLGVAGRPPSAR